MSGQADLPDPTALFADIGKRMPVKRKHDDYEYDVDAIDGSRARERPRG